MVRATVLASLFATAQAAEWAVLVAGSNTYGNYRHQADVCHAYQIVKSKGIPESNIIVMAYDDIANSGSNPFPGQIFNKPTAAGTAGVDVYAGCNIDYKGKDVTPANFEAVLTGTASGKKLESTSEDNVFVFFSDHGAAGLIAFPQGAGEMHKADLQSTFETMHSKNLYKKLTFYLETCESGSMFEGMTTPGVYALSASSPTESSWGTYCGGDAMVNGKSIGSCLGDLFSVSWMEDSDVEDLTSETLQQQSDEVTTATSKSKVMQWGDLSFQSDKVSEFQGDKASVGSMTQSKKGESMSAREVDLKQAYDNYARAVSAKERLAAGEELQKVIADQMEVEGAFSRFLEMLYPGDSDKHHAMRHGDSPANNRDCELATREAFVQHGKFDAYTGFALQFQRVIVEACADQVASGSNKDLVAAAKEACTSSVIV
jgi:legumain